MSSFKQARRCSYALIGVAKNWKQAAIGNDEAHRQMQCIGIKFISKQVCGEAIDLVPNNEEVRHSTEEWLDTRKSTRNGIEDDERAWDRIRGHECIM